jgi:hypothetical protein
MISMADSLPGGYYSSPLRIGDTVTRIAGPWSTNVHALLSHLAKRGFAKAPKYISCDESAGTETLSFIEGRAGTYPLTTAQRSDTALADVAETVRAIHDATVDFVPPKPDGWQYRATAPTEIDCIGHNDLGPYNAVYDGGRVVGIIDWDFAGPSSRAWDVCYAAHRFVPLSAPRSTLAFGWDAMPDQRARLRLFVEAYGLEFDIGYLLDLLVVRLSSIAADMERQISIGNRRFDRQRDERHLDGYREDIAYILAQREDLLRR